MVTVMIKINLDFTTFYLQKREQYGMTGVKYNYKYELTIWVNLGPMYVQARTLAHRKRVRAQQRYDMTTASKVKYYAGQPLIPGYRTRTPEQAQINNAGIFLSIIGIQKQ